MNRPLANLRERIRGALAHRFDCAVIIEPQIPDAASASRRQLLDFGIVMSNGSPGNAIYNMVSPVCWRIFNSEKETWLVL